jgi:hypothetical protein
MGDKIFTEKKETYPNIPWGPKENCRFHLEPITLENMAAAISTLQEPKLKNTYEAACSFESIYDVVGELRKKNMEELRKKMRELVKMPKGISKKRR